MATGDVIIIQDADLEYSPEDHGLLIQEIIDNKTDVVYGTRFSAKQLSCIPLTRLWHMAGNRLVTFVANLVYNTNITDVCTCLKALKKEVVKSLTLECVGFGIDVEITAEVLKRRYRIKEIPILYTPRSHKQGKKVNYFTDFFRIIYWIIRKKINGNIDYKNQMI